MQAVNQTDTQLPTLGVHLFIASRFKQRFIFSPSAPLNSRQNIRRVFFSVRSPSRSVLRSAPQHNVCSGSNDAVVGRNDAPPNNCIVTSAASMKLHVIKSLQERLNVYKRSKRAFISPSSSRFTHRNDGLHSARLEISLSWKRRLTISIRLRNVWLARCGRGAHVTRINSKDPSTTQYLHVSQVLQRFEHPPLYVFNFYPLYAPGG